MYEFIRSALCGNPGASGHASSTRSWHSVLRHLVVHSTSFARRRVWQIVGYLLLLERYDGSS